MKKPQLLKTMPKGGTIYSYQLTGGHTTYDKFLACNKGSCTFFNDLKQAEAWMM